MHEEVPLLFAALREARQLARGRLKLAIASLSPAEERARAVLHACGLHSTSAEGTSEVMDLATWKARFGEPYQADWKKWKSSHPQVKPWNQKDAW